jgi:hypothetical protein
LCNDLHHGQFLRVASNKVEEGKLVKVFRLLIRRLDNLEISQYSSQPVPISSYLVVPRLQSSSGQLVPYILPIHSFSHFKRNLQISTLDSKIKSSLLILNEMKSNLGIPFLL